MRSWLSLSQYQPAAPGLYWTRTDTETYTDAQGVKHTVYHCDWLRWDGQCWQDGQPNYFYGERPKGEK